MSGGDTSSSAWDVHQDRDEIDLAGPEDDQESSDVGISNVRRERASSLASSRSSGKNKPTDKEEGAHRGRDCRAGPVGNDSGWRYDRARREPSPISGRVARHDSHNDRPARSPSRGQPYRGRWNWPQDASRIEYSRGGEYGGKRGSGPHRSPSRGQPYGDGRNWTQDACRIEYSRGRVSWQTGRPSSSFP